MKWLLTLLGIPIFSLAVSWGIGRSTTYDDNRRAKRAGVSRVIWCDSCNHREAISYRDIDDVRYFICGHCTDRPSRIASVVVSDLPRRAIGQ